MNPKLEVRAMAAPWRRGVEFLVRSGRSVARLVMVDHPDDMVTEPTLTLDTESAQTLMDDLWQAGLRPTEGAGSAGSLRATEKHLEDMRNIAFKYIDRVST